MESNTHLNASPNREPMAAEGQSASRSVSATAPRSARKFPWTKDEDALLGKISDRELARKLNRTIHAVRGRRKFLGITAIYHAPQPFRMPPEPADGYAKLFASKSDKELKQILGWSYKRIRTRRRRLGERRTRQRREWTLEEDRLLGTKPDKVLARMFGRTPKAVRHRREAKRIRMTKKWRPEDDAVLGTRTDEQIGMLLNRTLGNVAWRRNKLGIAAAHKPREWTEEEEALLGKRTDAELAKLFGRTEVAVQGRRMLLGRPKLDLVVCKVIRRRNKSSGEIAINVKEGAAYCTWSAGEDALIGTMPDAQLAARLGCSVKRVSRRRRMLGLANANPEHRSWTDVEIALLGTAPDRDVGKLVNRSLENVRAKRLEMRIPFCNPKYEVWKPVELALLGQIPDAEIATRTGHSLKSVRSARQKRRIPNPEGMDKPWRPEEEALLGTAPDAEIAARLNRTLGAIRLRRITRRIPVWRDTGQP